MADPFVVTGPQPVGMLALPTVRTRKIAGGKCVQTCDDLPGLLVVVDRGGQYRSEAADRCERGFECGGCPYWVSTRRKRSQPR